MVILFIGTYTKPEPHCPDGRGEGIYTVEFNEETGRLTHHANGATAAGVNSAFLAVSKNRKWLYSVAETDPGQVSAFSIHPDTAVLTLLGTYPSAGGPKALPPSGPAHLSTLYDDTVLVVANYHSGSASSYAINPKTGALDGSTAAPATTIQFTHHSGVKVERQEAPHGHCVCPANDGSPRVWVPDLGGDRVYRIWVDRETGTMDKTSLGWVATPPGTGPRHMTLSVDGNFAYVITELSCDVIVYRVLPETRSEGTGGAGKAGLEQLQIVSIKDPSHPRTEYTCAADIHLTPDGRTLFASNRFRNHLTSFAVDKSTGLLVADSLSIIDNRGEIPRNFWVSPTGKWLIVANQDSHNMVVFKIDGKGQLEYSGVTLAISSPVCIMPW